MRSSKGQLWSLDFTAGVVILMFIFLVFSLLWTSLAIRWNSANGYRQMQTDALFASDSLMTTSGVPASWEMLPSIAGGNISAIGLVGDRDVIDPMKAAKLAAENASAYASVKQRLGLSRYQLGIRISGFPGNATYYEFGEFAGPLNESAAYDRIGLMNGSVVIMHMEVWR